MKSKHRLTPSYCTIKCPKCSGKSEFSPNIRTTKLLPTITSETDLKTFKVSALEVDVRLGKTLPASKHLEIGWGLAVCGACGRAGRHKLNWPQDAYYVIEIAKQRLWAIDRDFVVRLLKFVQSAKSSAPKKIHRKDLQCVPRVFFLKKHRDTLIRDLTNLLEL